MGSAGGSAAQRSCSRCRISAVRGERTGHSPDCFADWRFRRCCDLTPSFVSSAPNGPGFDAAKNETLRGFVDGQFNVTIDGIPFADPDNFQHHSTSYFPTSMLDHVVIDRSPGGAADLGYASF